MHASDVNARFRTVRFESCFHHCQTDDWQNRFTDLQTSTFYHQHLHNLRVCPMVAKIIGHYESALKKAPGFTTGTVAGVPDP